MRIFHLTPIPVSPEEVFGSEKNISRGGGWIASLISALHSRPDINQACAAFGSKKSITNRERLVFSIIPHGRAILSNTRCLESCRRLVNDYQPDIVHIHGTESSFGLLKARHMIDCPVVMSLQGLLGPYAEWYRFFGASSIVEIIRMHRFLELPVLRGLLFNYLRFRSRARREREIIQGNGFFLGRTAWDRAYIKARNPSARYYINNEILREPFFKVTWDIRNMKRHRILFTNGGHPRKGVELLFEAALLLKTRFPDIQVQIAGYISRRSGYGKYVRRWVKRLGPSACLLGQLNAEKMAAVLRSAHLFVSPSYIDNSPNAVCEAQLVGLPVLATYTGGLPSLVTDGETGLFVPTGDAASLAAKIETVFLDDQLAVRLGRQARMQALRRHDSTKIVDELIQTYQEIIQTTRQEGVC